jgi:predicted phage terminase large subunit-like protein
LIKLTKETIYGLSGSCLVQRFDGSVKTPDCHLEWWDLCCSPANYVAIAAPRGHAKSTAISFTYTLAELLFRSSNFVVIISDTESQASMFLGAIKQELQENENIIELFGIKKDAEGKVKFSKDSESDFICEFDDGHKFRVMARGSEQRLRGLLWNGMRPNLIVCDDLENDEIVMNKDRRNKFKRWFYGAVLPCLASRGKIRYVGTILHMDSLLENLMPKETDRQTFEKGLVTYSTKRVRWAAKKYKAHNEDFSLILWPEKHTAAGLKEIKQDYTAQGIPDVYSQEYLNVPLDESNTYFKKNDFLAMKKEDHEKKLNYYMTVDLAISDKSRADYSVFCIGGVDEDNYLYIRNVIRDRMDGREIVDTLLALQKVYNFQAIGIEEMMISKSIGPFLREEMIKNNNFLNIIPLKPHKTDKQMRARSMQARMRAGGVKFDKSADWYLDFEDELMKFPRAKHDDQVDALAYLGLMIDEYIPALTVKQQAQLEYDEEMEDSGVFEQGRSVLCGY